MKTLVFLSYAALLVLWGGCSSNHSPSVVDAYVSCDSYSDEIADTWSFSAFVEDVDGLEDVVSLQASLIDFDGEEQASLRLDNVEAGYWARTLSSDDFSLSCEAYEAFLYRFTACDQAGTCGVLDVLP